MRDGKDEWEVLYIWPYLEWGGAQIYFTGIMKRARERYDVRAIMPIGSGERLLSYMQQLDVPCEFFDAHLDVTPALTLGRKLKRRWRKALTEFVIARHLGRRRLRRAILHVDFGPWSSFWLLFYLSLRSHVFVTLHTALPKVSHLRRTEWKLKFSLLTLMPKFHLLASNRDMIKSLKPFLPERVIRKIRLAYSGVDREEVENALSVELNRANLCDKYKLPAKRFLVFGMGQFIERKGCWVLLQAAQQLRLEDPSMSFVWIGTGTLDAATEQRIEEYNLGDAFRLINSDEIGLSRLDLLMLLRLADLFVLPSFNEGLPVALLEAMALGKACVASTINAIPEAVTDGETGVLVPSGDCQALAGAIASLKGDDSLRERIARAGQAHVLVEFDEHLTSRTTVDLYDACSRAG